MLDHFIFMTPRIRRDSTRRQARSPLSAPAEGALLMFTRRSDIMGTSANGRATSVAARFGTAVVPALKQFLI
jgi:hypothetical protein